jgi:hypothetical protein
MDQLVGKVFELERENAELREKVARMQPVVDYALATERQLGTDPTPHRLLLQALRDYAEAECPSQWTHEPVQGTWAEPALTVGCKTEWKSGDKVGEIDGKPILFAGPVNVDADGAPVPP